MVQVVEHLPSKYKVLSPNLSIKKEKKKKERKKMAMDGIGEHHSE
jgi:hypothetical protein